ncbi:MAG: HAD-IC family P-type ATPase, partial [Acetobacteraceae bacterium]|nr:HAD-IC family P-type ATPase [Acetobacteraceae bacterium]
MREDEARVRLVHALPGRARLAVRGLRRAPALGDRLRRGLRETEGVTEAWASADTGTVLVLHDQALEHPALLARAEAILAGQAPRGGVTGNWHARRAENVLAEVDGQSEGLTTPEARRRLREAGPNLLPRPPGRDSLAILVDQFRTLPTLLLAGAAALSVCTGGLAEAVAIAAVLGLNGAIAFTVESRAERTIRGLEGPAGVATVLREGRQARVPAGEVVPGDLLVLARDHAVLADARVLRAQELSINEATLTGESLPVMKAAEPVAPEAPLADRDSMVWRGTAVTGGSGLAVVVATGRRTEIGRIHALLGEAAPPPTAMQVELDRVGRQLVWASLAACGAVFGIGALRGLGLMGLVRSSVSLGIAAIPEGLPTVATTTLARGVEEARREGVLVRRLDAVETLGSVDVACFDKTGTLTANRMEVAALVGEGPVLGGERF